MPALAAIAKARERWRQLWTRVGASAVPEQTFDALLEAYEEPHRAYHTFTHVLACLEVFDGVPDCAEHPVEVELAIWFHDAVYDSTRDDNEARSADWVTQVLRQADAPTAMSERVRQLILATRHDTPADTPDAALLLDIDLSILGADPARFRRYEDQVRREYAWVPDELFRARRAEVLEGFLRRKPLYRTPELRSRFEDRARSNLRASIRAHRRAEDLIPACGPTPGHTDRS